MGLNDPDQHHLPLATHWAWSHSLGCVGVPVRSPALGGGTPPAAPLQPPSLLLLTAQGPGSHLLWGCQWSLWGSQLCLPWATACWGAWPVLGSPSAPSSLTPALHAEVCLEKPPPSELLLSAEACLPLPTAA